MVPRRPIWCALAALVVLGACAPDSDGDAATTTPPPTARPTEPSQPPATQTPTVPSTSPPTTSEPAPVASLSYVDEEQSVLAIIDERDDTTRFAALAAALDSDDVFRQARGVTVLVPVDSAFDAMGDAEFEALLADPTAVALLLSEHLAVGVTSIEQLVDRGAMVNAIARTLPVTEEGGEVSIGGAQVVVPDLVADNGVVHLIDAVLQP
jgi:uncharacterized surface protein with fasciclin (FAS1) repeats